MSRDVPKDEAANILSFQRTLWDPEFTSAVVFLLFTRGQNKGCSYVDSKSSSTPVIGKRGTIPAREVG